MRRTGIALLAAGAALAIAGFLLLSGDNETSGDVEAVVDALTNQSAQIETPEDSTAPTTTTTAPPLGQDTEEQPVDEAPAEVARPIGLRIDQLGVDAPIGEYGVDPSGEMAVPDNVDEVGWYKFGPKPGESGSSVLAAHVDLAGSGPGVFFELRTLEEGDRLYVTHDDGSETAYRVIARTTYLKDELPLDAIFSREGPSVLTLITCGGGFNSSIARYDSNVVVYAVPDIGDASVGGSTL